jgi:hypothetical protein
VLAVNPPPVSGSLRTDGTADGDVSFELSNVEALDEETDDFWDTGGSPRAYSTGSVVYRPSYNEYGQPPQTVYDSTVLYDNFTFEGATIARSGQTLIDGSTISLVALNGSLQRSSSGAASVDVRPVSASSTTVTVTDRTDGDPIEVRTATQLPERQWEEILADQRVSEGGNISNGDDAVRTESLGVPGYRTLVVELVPGTYELRMAKAGVGTRVAETERAYMTDVRINGTAVPESGSALLTVEVRDAYNNPVSGVEVTGATGDATVGALESPTSTTGGDGRATFLLETESVSEATALAVNFSYDVDPGSVGTFDADRPENVGSVVEVQNTEGSAGPGSGGSAPYDLDWESPSSDYTWDVGKEGDTLTLRAGTTPDVAEATVDFALNDSSIAELSPSEETTDPAGDATTTLTALAPGTVKLYAVSGGASDVVNVTVTNTTATPRLSSTVVDQGQTGSRARYEVSYDIANTADFDRVEVSFRNLDSGGADQTYTSTDSRNNVDDYGWTDTYGGTGGDTYEITIDVYDTNGDVVDSRTVTDDADGVDPSGNADLSEADSPTLDSATLTDTSQYSNVNYDLEYAVTDSAGKYTETEVLFYNRDTATATGQETGTSLSETVSYSAGGAEGDQYDVIVQVQDDDGIVVDQRVITDTADGDDIGSAFTGTSVADVVPNANQRQVINFTVGSSLGGGETVDIDLGAAQSSSPERVDYSSAGVTLVDGPGGSSPGFVTQTTDDAVIRYYAPSGGLAAGERISLRVTNVTVGPPGNQNNPYGVSLSRSDGGSASTSFSAAYDAGSPDLSSVSVTRVTAGDSRSQTFEFILGSGLADGEQVVVDLSDAQSTGSSGVDYQNANGASTTQGSGSASLTANPETAYVVYTAGSSDTAGDTVSIDVSGQSVRDDSSTGTSTYTVGFSREDADTVSTTFDVAAPLSGLEAQVSGTTGGGSRAKNIQFSYTLDQSAGSVTLRAIDTNGDTVTGSGATAAGSQTETISFKGSDGNYPVTVEIEVDGACYRATLTGENDVASDADGDWTPCT